VVDDMVEVGLQSLLASLRAVGSAHEQDTGSLTVNESRMSSLAVKGEHYHDTVSEYLC